MLRLFKRRDTRVWALTLGGIAALVCLVFALGTPLWWPALQAPLAIVLGVAVAAFMVWRRRKLPPDVDLRWADPAEADHLNQASPPPDRTLLQLTFSRDFGSRHRLDVMIDGEHVGQLRPGTSFYLPLRPGLRKMVAWYDTPRASVSETINSIGGFHAGYTIRKTADRAIRLEIHRDSVVRSVPGKHIRLVYPAVPEA